MERLNIVLVLGRSREGGREGGVVKEKKNPYAATEMNLMISGVGGGDFGLGVEESPFLAPDNQN